MKINTVTGSVDVADLGSTLIHEHVICSSPEFMQAFHPRWNDPAKVIPDVAAKLKYVKDKYGVTTIVDGTPMSLGRDLDLLKRVSEESGVYIIASTGFYTGECFTVNSNAPELLADWMIDEINNGAIKPAFLKCAFEYDVTPFQQRVVHVLALVMKATGLPVFAHSNAGRKTGFQILDEFAKYDIPFNKIIVGHTADAQTADYPLALLERGAYVSLDRLHRGSWQGKADVIGELIRKGWEKKLFLAHDAICYPDRCNVMNGDAAPEALDRLAVVHECVLPYLRESGIQEESFTTILQGNIQALLAE